MRGDDRRVGALTEFLNREAYNSHDSELYVLINALPKTGSSYLYNLLSKVTKYRKVYLSNALYRTNSQDLYLPSLIDSRYERTVSRHHFLATDQNVGIMKLFEIYPVLLVRNIYDLIVSFTENQKYGIENKAKGRYDKLDSINYKHTGFKSVRDSVSYGYAAIGYYDEKFLELSKEEQYDFVINTTLPWILMYIASWENAVKQGINVLWISYEDLIAETTSTLTEVLDFYQIEKSSGIVSQAIGDANNKKTNNYNIGIMGRGRCELTLNQVDRIKKICDNYTGVDFSLIGIEQ